MTSKKKSAKLRPDVAEAAYRVMLEATGQVAKTPPPDELEADGSDVREGATKAPKKAKK